MIRWRLTCCNDTRRDQLANRGFAVTVADRWLGGSIADLAVIDIHSKTNSGWHFSFSALIFSCVFQFNLLFSNQFLSSLIQPTIDWVKNLREMGKAEKLSPSPTYSNSGSKRSKMIVKAVRQTDESATRQYVSANTAMKMDETVETVETDRETSESDENWQTVMNQRSNKVQKTNSHAPTTTMSFFGQTIPQDSKANGVHSYFSFGDNDTRAKPTSPQHGLEKSSPGGSSAHTDGRRRRANLPQFK